MTLRALLACLLVWVSQRALAADLVVSASIVLKEAFLEIGAAFEQAHPEHRARFNFGAGGLLRSQIEQGAPVDVFASAHTGDLDVLRQKGFVANNGARVFARNRIVLVKSEKSNIQSLRDLNNGTVKRIALGNPKTVSAGKYASHVLTFYRLSETLKPKLVFAENVRQVLDYAERGEVDAAFVFATDARLIRSAKQLLVVDAAAHSPVEHGVAVVQKSRHQQPARLFVEFLLAIGKPVLRKHGFE